MGTRCHQVLRAQCVAPRCRRPPALLNTDQGGDYARLWLVTLPSRWNDTVFIACISLREISFQNFNFSTFRFSIPRQAMHQHRPILLISGPQSSFNMAHLKPRSVYSQGISYIIVATSLSPRFGPTEKGSLAKSLESWGNYMGTCERANVMDCRGQWTM